ncbi:hypothetical protein ALC57_01529 [Trachymyrmex cornetzi]|uniref:MADF domain-containing protein n=1 Tax=Trachymyrmex cornetzi TaxID=471704 RepID=A0A151JPM9_9HYME|nr:hypothetical protein ALC57_01529 [Trachymyrmex cornetzi]
MANVENIPPTKCGHCGWLITALLKENIKQHSCFGLFDETTHVLCSDDKNNILMFDKDKFVSASNDKAKELQSTTSNTKGKMTKTAKAKGKQIENEYNEKLIAAIQKRPPLYDCRLPLKSRNNLKKEALWKEVANIVQGMLRTHVRTKL